MVVTPQASLPAGATVTSARVTVKKGKEDNREEAEEATLRKKGTYKVTSYVKYVIPESVVPGVQVTRQTQKWVEESTTRLPDSRLPDATQTVAVQEIDLVGPQCEITYRQVTWFLGLTSIGTSRLVTWSTSFCTCRGTAQPASPTRSLAVRKT